MSRRQSQTRAFSNPKPLTQFHLLRFGVFQFESCHEKHRVFLVHLWSHSRLRPVTTDISVCNERIPSIRWAVTTPCRATSQARSPSSLRMYLTHRYRHTLTDKTNNLLLRRAFLSDIHSRLLPTYPLQNSTRQQAMYHSFTRPSEHHHHYSLHYHCCRHHLVLAQLD